MVDAADSSALTEMLRRGEVMPGMRTPEAGTDITTREVLGQMLRRARAPGYNGFRAATATDLDPSADSYVPRVPIYGDNGERLIPAWETEGGRQYPRDFLEHPGRHAQGALSSALMTMGLSGNAPGFATTAMKTLADKAPQLAAGALGLGAMGGAVEDKTPDPLTKLRQDQAALQQQMQDAIKLRESKRPKGKGVSTRDDHPQFWAADDEVKRLDSQMTGLGKQIEYEQRRNSPEAQLEAEKAKKDFADQQRLKAANTPTKELYPEIWNAVPGVTAGTAALIGMLATRGHLKNYNTEIGSLSERWQQAIERANQSSGAGRTRAVTEAEGLGKEFEALKSAGPSKAGTVGPGAAAGELGQLAPIAIDYARAVPGSDLYDKTTATMKDWKEVLARAGQGVMWGYLPAKVGAGATKAIMSKDVPPGYAGETGALRASLAPPGSASSPKALPLAAPASTPPSAAPVPAASIEAPTPAPQAPAPAPKGSKASAASSSPENIPEGHTWDEAVGRVRNERGEFAPTPKQSKPDIKARNREQSVNPSQIDDMAPMRYPNGKSSDAGSLGAFLRAMA